MPGNYTITNRVNGEDIDAPKYLADHQQHVDNLEPPKVDDYSGSLAQMQAMADPGELGTESQPTSLAGEIERLRFAIQEIKGTSQWYQTAQASLVTLLPTGTGPIPYMGSTAPAGFVLMAGNTIGSATSGATERANADTEALFTLLWNSIANAELPIQDSTGAASTRGASATVDFAANKRLPVPDARNRAVFFKGAAPFATLGAVGGSQTLPPHAHTGGTTSGPSLFDQTLAGAEIQVAHQNHTHTLSVTGNPTTSPSIVNPFLVANALIKL